MMKANLKISLLLSFFFLCIAGILKSEAPYKILYDSTVVEVAESGLSYVNFHQRYRINTLDGALELSTIKLDYDPLSAFVEFKSAVIHRKDGEMEVLDLTSVSDYPAPARMIYWGARQKMLSTGRLFPGDELEIRWFRKGYTYALLGGEEDERYIPPMRGHFYDIVEFWSKVPLDRKVYILSLPSTKNLQYKIFNGEILVSQVVSGEHLKYTFAMENIAPFKGESNMVALSDVAPKLVMSTSPDWEAKSIWFYSVNEEYGSFEWNDAIQKKVNEILEPAKNEYDSIALLTHWVADEIRYSGISMGEGEGYTLHKGAMTFTDRCGVCKDKAGMLVTMLRAAGFESYAAMTMAGSRIEDIPADQFNHSVTAVKLKNGEFRMLDPTWVPFVRELWSSAEQQQNYLMGLPQGADLMITDVSPPQAHYFRLDGFSSLESDGSMVGGFTLTAEGQSDAAIRRMFTSSLKSSWMRRIESALQDVHPRAELLAADFADPYDYSQPMLIRVEYNVPGYATVSEDKIIFTPFLLAAPFRQAMNHLFMNTEKELRDFPFRDRCSREVGISEVIRLPKFKEIEYVSQAQLFNGIAGDFEGVIKRTGEQEITVAVDLRLNKRVYEAHEWPSFREVVSLHKRYSEEPVILSR